MLLLLLEVSPAATLTFIRFLELIMLHWTKNFKLKQTATIVKRAAAAAAAAAAMLVARLPARSGGASCRADDAADKQQTASQSCIIPDSCLAGLLYAA